MFRVVRLCLILEIKGRCNEFCFGVYYMWGRELEGGIG